MSVQAGFFAKIFGEAAEAAPQQPAAIITAADIPLLTALKNPNPLGARGGADIVVDGNVLVSTGPVGEDEIAEQKSSMGEIRVYTVREGDSLSQIAEMFGVTTNTIMWANDLSRATAIQPGDTLVILPIVGVQHVVKSGDTISTIAKKYEGDTEEILAYNQLTSADEISVGDTLIIPGGAMHSAPVRVAASAQPVRVSGASSASSASFSHPAPGSVKTQGIHGYNAVDLASGYATPIRAAAAGEVIVSKSSGWNGGYGQYIVIRHANGTQTLYSHLMRNDVGVGAYVAQGEVIGGMGSTGKSTGTHLHFEVRGARNPF
jgi:LysM repeat protein